MMVQIVPAIPMANMLFNKLYELYYTIARLGLGLGGIVYDIEIPRTRCASRCEGIDELDQL
jgi:hypothetical protein